MIKQICIFLVIFSGVGYLAFSQGGSSYSVFGLGDIFSSITATADGLASTQIAMPSETMINTTNPAMWSYVSTTRLQAGYHFNQNYIISKDYSLYQNNGKVSSILAIFSVDTSMGLSIGMGIMPYSTVNYYLTSPYVVTVEGIDIGGLNTYQGSGGLSIGYLGGSINLMKNLSVGAEMFGTFGSINSSIYTTLNDPNSYPTGNNKVDKFSGFGFKGGLFYNMIGGLSIGAFAQIQSKLTSQHTVNYISYTASDSTYSSDLDIKVPPAYGVGVSYKTGKILIGADLITQNFSNFVFQKDIKVDFKNNLQFSIGFSKLGSKYYSSHIIDKINYNLGFCYKQLYYTINNTNINEYYGSFGVDIPLVNDVMLSGGVQLGSRGTLNGGLLQENFGRLTVDLSIGETWFKPYKREYEK